MLEVRTLESFFNSIPSIILTNFCSCTRQNQVATMNPDPQDKAITEVTKQDGSDLSTQTTATSPSDSSTKDQHLGKATSSSAKVSTNVSLRPPKKRGVPIKYASQVHLSLLNAANARRTLEARTPYYAALHQECSTIARSYLSELRSIADGNFGSTESPMETMQRDMGFIIGLAERSVNRATGQGYLNMD